MCVRIKDIARKKNMKSFGIVRFIAVTAFLAFSWGCLGNCAITVRDSSGAKVVLKESACRIVSTVPSNTEILYALGLKDQVVGLTKYCDLYDCNLLSHYPASLKSIFLSSNQRLCSLFLFNAVIEARATDPCFDQLIPLCF
jgi:hypothetical protein